MQLSRTMSPLRVPFLCALLCLVSGKFSILTDCLEIVTKPGSEVTLPITVPVTLTHTEPGRCDQIEWKYREKERHNYTQIARHKACAQNIFEFSIFTNVTVTLSENGSLIIHNVTEKYQGNYSVDILNSTNNFKRTHNYYYNLHVEVPVSVPLLNISCLPDGNAWISCRVENGTNPSISLTVNAGSPERSSSDHMTVTKPSPGPWNVTCSAKNRVSETKTHKIQDSCPVPLSSIHLNTTCFPDGSAEAFCWVYNGSDPRYSWSLDGRPPDGRSLEGRPLEGRSPDGRSVSSYSRITLPPPVSGLLRCDAENVQNNISISDNIFCPVPVSDPILEVSCMYNNSAEISCRVDHGTDPRFSLIVNGEAKISDVTSSGKEVNVTLPPVSPPQSWNITCVVQNSISNRVANKIHEACTAPLSAPEVMVWCQQDGSASVSCVLEMDQEATYNWTVNGAWYQENHSGNITITNEKFSSGPLNVSCSVQNSVSLEKSNHTLISCPAPLSAPEVMVWCQQDGSASVSCVLEMDQEATYNWTVNGAWYQENHSGNITITNEKFSSGPLNVSCSVQNSVSLEKSNHTLISCPAPVSAPELNISCLGSGRALVSCRVLNGTDPQFSLSLNGKPLLIGYNSSRHGVNHTVSMTGLGNFSCSVTNRLNVSKTSYANMTCPVSCLSCLTKSLIGGSIALIVTLPPLFIHHWYALPRSKKQA
ncbi:uncharacterized protein [Hyperolius riggenbachi]|uniref:uncharacterized protein isoform X2 n=1 Tax=Hyperolius riggenbachi TaxID=752182 RepID=UPI0035A3A374